MNHGFLFTAVGGFETIDVPGIFTLRGIDPRGDIVGFYTAAGRRPSRSLTRATPSSTTVFRDRRQIVKSWSSIFLPALTDTSNFTLQSYLR